MKLPFNFKIFIFLLALTTLSFSSCRKVTSTENTEATEKNSQKIEVPKKELSEGFKEYWYAGTAEISSYKLEQAGMVRLEKGKQYWYM